MGVARSLRVCGTDHARPARSSPGTPRRVKSTPSRAAGLDEGAAFRYRNASEPKWRNGRRRGFKIPRARRVGSSPALGTSASL